MKANRAWRNKKGPSVSLSFTAPPDETASFEEAAQRLGLTRAAFFYTAVAKEARRVLKKYDNEPLAHAS